MDQLIYVFKVYGLGSHQIVADCFQNISGTKNDNSLNGKEDPGKDELASLMVLNDYKILGRTLNL